MILRKLPAPLDRIEVRRINREIARFGARFAHFVLPATDALPPQKALASVPPVPMPARALARPIDAPAMPAIPERKTAMSVATIIREGERRAARDRADAAHRDFVAQSLAAYGRSRTTTDHGWDRAMCAVFPDLYEDPRAVFTVAPADIPEVVRVAALTGRWSLQAIAASWDYALAPFAAREEDLARLRGESTLSGPAAEDLADPSPQAIATRWDAILAPLSEAAGAPAPRRQGRLWRPRGSGR